MTWKLWHWWRSPPLDYPPVNRAQSGGSVNSDELDAALQRAQTDDRRAGDLTRRAKALEERAKTQRVDNHFGADLYDVWRTRRTKE